MSRRRIIRWLIFASCVAVLMAAMGWGTRHLLHLEREREKMARHAEEQEVLRLALWRMDSSAMGLLVAENARPPEQYLAFPDLDHVYTRNFQRLGKGETFIPSPLLTHEPGDVRLYFMEGSDGIFTSPQVPVGNQRDLAETYYHTDAATIGQQKELLKKASSHFRAETSSLDDFSKDLAKKEMRSEASVGNPQGRFLEEKSRGVSATDPYVGWEAEVPQSARIAIQTAEKTKSDNEVAQVQDSEQQARYGYGRQTDYNLREGLERSKVVQSQVLNNTNVNSQARLKGQAPEVSSWTVEQQVAGALKKADALAEEQVAKTAPIRAAADSYATPGADPVALSEADAAPFTGAAVLSSPARKTASEVAEDESELRLGAKPFYANRLVAQERKDEVSDDPFGETNAAGPFEPLFVGEELFLVREAKLDGQPVRQFCWLNREAIEKDLLGGISDILPNATLVPSEAHADGSDPRTLAALPFRLEGSPPLAMAGYSPLWSPLRRSLLIAWICILAAAAAVAALLRGAFALSERRGAFVSAVTHELRTPLTTFQLYSDLLADDMVKDASKRKEYLEVMRGEAGRLGHLVENVLAYAQLEKGGSRRRAETLTLGALVNQIEDRLRQRTSQENMELVVDIPPEASERELTVDVSAVEQILFNLVDNACKYAPLHAEGDLDPRIHLEADGESSTPMLRVRDHGQGIARSEAKRLFKPFRKSAKEASHSAPGVGLGLALCRQLSSKIGGKLRLEDSSKEGASFVLELPTAS